MTAAFHSLSVQLLKKNCFELIFDMKQEVVLQILKQRKLK